jgi:uncharacterized protein YigA (DUF484 family)
MTQKPTYKELETRLTALEEEAIKYKKVEEELHHYQKRFNTAQRMALLGTWVWDSQTGEVEWSKEVYHIF